MVKRNTIAAISTPIGAGGIGIVRVSGDDALDIVKKHIVLLNNKNNNEIIPRMAHLATFNAENFKEQCIVIFFKNPNSYTGENLVEIQCHGGVTIANGILKTLLNSGARLAEAGEFTKRAFLNGKISLDKAEGVMDMINAESESEVKAGYNLLNGELSKKVKTLQDNLTNLLAEIEVALDYPEHDIEEQTSEHVYNELLNIEKELNNVLKTSKTGLQIKNGTRIAIVGKPNVGKSSLMNALLNFDRAIVTNIQGTTRDVLEETYVYNGVKFVLIDTAGVRESTDIIEQMGIEKSLKSINSADVILFVVDSSSELTKEDLDIYNKVSDKNTILVVNKTDLPSKIDLSKLQFKHQIKLSALTKANIDDLKQLIYNLVINSEVLQSNLIITNERQIEAIRNALTDLNYAKEGIKLNNSLDLISIDLNNLWNTLGEITGTTSNEEIINKIFSNFCVGK